MAQRLVKTIRATQVRSIGQPTGSQQLSASEMERLASVADRFQDVIALRRAGLTPQQIHRLEFVRWSLQREGRDRP